MKYLWIALIAILIGISDPLHQAVAADAISTEGLSPESQKTIEDLTKTLKDKEKAAVPTKPAEVKPPVVTVDDLTEYAKIGQAYGTALIETAKAMGVAADEILKSTAGQIAMFIIVWKMIGKDMLEYFLGIFGGLVWFSVMIPGWVWSLRRFVLKDVEIKETLKDGVVTERVYQPMDWSDGSKGALLAVHVVALLLICITGFVMVF